MIMTDKFLISDLSSLQQPLRLTDYTVIERDGVTYKMPTLNMYTNMFIDDQPTELLKLYHIGRDEFWDKVRRHDTLSNGIYFVSGDYEHMYGRRICYMADPISA